MTRYKTMTLTRWQRLKEWLRGFRQGSTLLWLANGGRSGTRAESTRDEVGELLFDRAVKTGGLKRYVVHVTLRSNDCPHEEEFDWVKARQTGLAEALREEHNRLAPYTREATLTYSCPKGGRDEGLRVVLEDLLGKNPGYHVARDPVPAFDGWEKDREHADRSIQLRHHRMQGKSP